MKKKLLKYLIITLSVVSALSFSACGKKKQTAEEYNESIAASRAAAEAEMLALKEQEEERKREEEKEKFTAKSDAEIKSEKEEKEEANRQRVINESIEAIEEDIVEDNKTYYENFVVVDSDDEQVVKEVESQAQEVQESLAASEDVQERVQQYTELQENEVDILQLEDEAWQDIVVNIQRSTTPEFAGYNGHYANLDAVYSDIDSTYASYSENVRNSFKSLAKNSWEYYTDFNDKLVHQANPWTAEELEEDPSRMDYTRDEYEELFGGYEQIGGVIMDQ